MKKNCPICDNTTIRYNSLKNVFNCDSCDFHVLAEDFYGCTYLRGHLKFQKYKEDKNGSTN